MAHDPMDAEALLKSMADALPTHEKDDTTSDLSSSLDVVALFVHACMTSLGFRLRGFNEDRPIDNECTRLAPRLPTQWNKSLNSHSFVYAHTQSAMTFVLHISRMGAKIDIKGLATGHDRIASFDISSRDYISTAALPLRIPMTESGTEDRSNLQAKLKDVFMSPTRITGMYSLSFTVPTT
ncbi:hypothetical protein N0V88_006977 [Collariella sp. IMI 366227]|nr:hypothetical protein N0V88_006977 [Collariella sp. IMI 366227]